jgi:hypothetical protein
MNEAKQLAILTVTVYAVAGLGWLMLFWINRKAKGMLGGLCGALMLFIMAYRTFTCYMWGYSPFSNHIISTVYATAALAGIQVYCFIAPHIENIKARIKTKYSK